MVKEYFEEMLCLLIEHGGDAGGAYFSNPKGMRERCDFIKNMLGLYDYDIVWEETDSSGYTHDDYPKLVLKNK